jgi:hypothetical protein
VVAAPAYDVAITTAKMQIIPKQVLAVFTGSLLL